MFDRLQSLLFQKADSRQLAAFRILVGLWFLTDYIVDLAMGWVQSDYVDPILHFPFIGFEWVQPLPSLWMHLHFGLVGLAALGILLGYRYRWSLSIFLLGHLYIFFIDIVYNLNKTYLFLLLGFLLLFVDANRQWSIDVLRKPTIKKQFVPRWNLLAFQFMFILIYTYSGISKLNTDWLIRMQPLTYFLGGADEYQAVENGIWTFVIPLFIYGGVVFDLSIGWLLLNRKTNVWANLFQASFHTLNLFVLQIGSLSIFMIFTTWLLFPTNWLKKRLGIQVPVEGNITVTPGKSKRITVILLLFAMLQVLLPNRHYLTGNDVNWTEKGHRFAWRLMTRTKSGSFSTFEIYDRKSDQRWHIEPREYLTSRQYRKMSAETDLVLSFAHYLKREWAKKGFPNVEIRGQVLTRLNRRNSQHLVSPDLDLTKCKRTFIRDEVSTKLKR